MQMFWTLHIEDETSLSDHSFDLLGRLEESLGAYSRGMGIKADDHQHWWERFDTFTRGEYLESMDLAEEKPDPEVLLALPEDKSYYRNHDELLQHLNQVIYYFTDDEFVAREREEAVDFFPENDVLHPNHLPQVVAELTRLRDMIRAAKERGAGFYLHVWLDY